MRGKIDGGITTDLGAYFQHLGVIWKTKNLDKF